MVSGELPEWLPPGFTVKIKKNDGRKVKYYLNVATGKKYYSKNEVIRCGAENNSLPVTPQRKNDDGRPSSNLNADSISDKTQDSAAWLPSGWTVEERKRMSGLTQGIPYKIYTELSTGSKFYSKAAVTRYLNVIGHADTTTKQNMIGNVDEPLSDKSLQVLPMTYTSRTDEKKRKGNSLVKIDNVDEPIPEMLPQIIPITNTDDAHDQGRKGNALVKIGNVGAPLPDSSPLVNSGTNTDGTVVKKRKGGSFVTVAVERTAADGLPSGWIKVIRISKSGNKTRKEPYYTDPVSGYMFRSKPDALRYLKTNDISSCACRPFKREDGIKLLENKNAIIPMTSTNDAHDQERKGNSLVKIGNVSEPLPDSSPLVNSGTNTDGTVVKKRKGRSFVTVAVERTTADDLPSGWIKVIRTSKSGNRTRKEPYYADPVSGYMFLSKPDALRYLKTNDISSCACRPLKREDGIKLLENKNSSSNPATGKLSMEKSELFLCEGSNGGGESSGTKNPPDTDTKTLKRKQANNDNATFTPVGSLFLQEKVTSENSKKNAEMEHFPQGENYVSKNDERAVAVDVALSSTPITGRGGRSNPGSRKSKKRTNSSLPLRASKRLAGSEPEIQSNMELKERSPRATVRGSIVHEVDTSPSFPLEASDIPQTSNIKPPKEPTYHTVRIEETLQDVNQLKEVEKPPTEGSPIPEPAPVVKESHNSKLCYDFGESWSDPLEFALKTLRGEIPIDDTLTFPSFFGDGCLSQTDSVAPGNIQSEQPSKKKNVDPSPTISSPLFSTLGNISFSSSVGVNFQPSTEVVKKDSQSQTKFHP